MLELRAALTLEDFDLPDASPYRIWSMHEPEADIVIRTQLLFLDAGSAVDRYRLDDVSRTVQGSSGGRPCAAPADHRPSMGDRDRRPTSRLRRVGPFLMAAAPGLYTLTCIGA